VRLTDVAHSGGANASTRSTMNVVNVNAGHSYFAIVPSLEHLQLQDALNAQRRDVQLTRRMPLQRIVTTFKTSSRFQPIELSPSGVITQKKEACGTITWIK